MKRHSEDRKRIKKVMADLEIANQAAFAKALGFRPTTVSAWMTGTSLPSPDAYVALANKAPDLGDSIYFLGRAGLTQDAPLSALARVFKDRFRIPMEGEVYDVPPLNLDGTAGTGPTLPFPAKLLPNPASTYFIRFEKDTARFFFAPGDIVVLDTHDCDSPDLTLLMDRVVLIQLPFRRGPKGELLENPDKDKGLLMGRLFFGGGPAKWTLSLISVGAVANAPWEIADHWTPEGKLADSDALAEAARNIRLSPDWRIIGRLVAYLPG